MTDKEKIELAVRRVSQRAIRSDLPLSYWLEELADEIANVGRQQEVAQTRPQGGK